MLDKQRVATIRAMPKVELHRHLEGALRLNTLLEIVQTTDINIAVDDLERLRPLVQMMPDDPRTAQQFLSKFSILRQFYRSIAIIERITYEMIEDAAADNIKYMEVRFTPKALTAMTDVSIDEMTTIVCRAANAAANQFGITVRLIISINRHEALEAGEQALRAALNNRHLGVVGLDLAGNELHFTGLEFRDIFKRAKAAALKITIHAGEWRGAENVWNAIGNLGADRLGHGVNAIEDQAIIQILKDRQIALELCPTSNVLSGTVSSMAQHPIHRLTCQGALTTINTDDPLICRITLSQEIAHIADIFKLSWDEIKQFQLRAARAAFLELPEKERLIVQLQHELDALDKLPPA